MITEEHISNLENRIVENSQPEQQKEKKNKMGYFKELLGHHQAY